MLRAVEGTLVDGRYTLQARLGRGAAGHVWEARTAGGATVAVKLLHDQAGLDDEARRRLEREARALNGITHPAVVDVLDFGVHEGTPYLVMERLVGEPLDEVLDRGVHPRAGFELARRVVDGLAAVHAAGVLHRDVKPANVVVTAEGLRLIDFGLAKFVDAARWGAHSALTGPGAQLGTPAYMPPELCFGEPADAASDVYSAGILVFEAVTGAPPFEAEDRLGWVRAHAQAPIPRLGERRPGLVVPEALDGALARALAKERTERFPDAGAFAALLATVDPAAVG